MPKRKNKTNLQEGKVVEHKQGKPWTTVSTHELYEDASKKVMEVIANFPTYSAKIRRTSENKFKVVKRLNEQLDAVAKKMEKKAEENKEKNSKKKSKK